jgi:hypothetical protein
MALKVKIEKLEDVAEGERAFYKKQDDGSFLLETEGEPEAGALKSTLAKERREKAELQRKLKAFGELTPEEVTEMQDRIAEIDANEAGKPNVDVDKAVEKATKPLKTQLDQANATIAEQQSHIDRFTRVDAARGVFEKLGDWDLLEPHVLPNLKAVREEVEGADGKKVVKWVAQVVDPNTGEVRDGVTIEKLADEMKASGKYGRAFDGTGASGSGAPPSGGSHARTPVASSGGDAKQTKRSSTYNAL